MADLQVNYLGLELANPLVASASPLSKKLDRARHLEDAGASAIVMYSLFEEQLLAEERQFERFMHNQSLGHGEASSFLPESPEFQGGLDQYLEQLQLLKSHLGIPVIASLNGVSEQGWVNYGRDLQDAGADALEINVYYVAANADETSLEVERRYLDVLAHLEDAVSIPVSIKLSPQFSSPLHFVSHLHQAGAAGVVIFNRFYQSDINLETLAVEPNLQLSDPYESLLRIRWAAILRGALDIDIAVTGGFHNSADVIKALLVGANVVQLASVLLEQGPQHISSLLQELETWLDEHEYESVRQLQGSLSHRNAADPGAFERESYLSVLDSFTPPPGVRY
ncbi:MAG: dihydroorotate dehydrogenase-like protein [Halieaceae bacterium]